MKINDRRELQNITINHFVDIDCNLQRIYKKTYSFLNIDAILPANDPLNFRKKIISSCKDDSN